MRLRFGVAMPEKGGRPAVVGVEVTQGTADGRTVYDFRVGYVNRVVPPSVEAVADVVLQAMTGLSEYRPCAIVDVGSPQGLALRQHLRRSLAPTSLHAPHAYTSSVDRRSVFAAILEAYARGGLTFDPKLRYRVDLDRALIFFGGQGHKKGDADLSSEDEALVTALGLALQWPSHGSQAVSTGSATRS